MRTGKMKGITKIVIPYFDTEAERQYLMLTVEGTTYASKIYAGIREVVRDNFGIEVDRDWLENVPLIVNQYDPEFIITDEERAIRIEKFIQSMELKDDDEVEGITDIGSTSEDVTPAEQPMFSVQNRTSVI